MTKPKRQPDKHPLTLLYPPGTVCPYPSSTLNHTLNGAHGSGHDMLKTMNAFPPPLFSLKPASSGLISLANMNYEPMHAIEHILPPLPLPVSAASAVPTQGTKLDVNFICSFD